MGSLREAARDRDWRGGLGLAHSRLGSVQISSYELSKFAAALTRLVALYARARRAATGRAAAELWGLCARPLAIERRQHKIPVLSEAGLLMKNAREHLPGRASHFLVTFGL